MQTSRSDAEADVPAWIEQLALHYPKRLTDDQIRGIVEELDRGVEPVDFVAALRHLLRVLPRARRGLTTAWRKLSTQAKKSFGVFDPYSAGMGGAAVDAVEADFHDEGGLNGVDGVDGVDVHVATESWYTHAMAAHPGDEPIDGPWVRGIIDRIQESWKRYLNRQMHSAFRRMRSGMTKASTRRDAPSIDAAWALLESRGDEQVALPNLHLTDALGDEDDDDGTSSVHAEGGRPHYLSMLLEMLWQDVAAHPEHAAGDYLNTDNFTPIVNELALRDALDSMEPAPASASSASSASTASTASIDGWLQTLSSRFAAWRARWKKRIQQLPSGPGAYPKIRVQATHAATDSILSRVEPLLGRDSSGELGVAAVSAQDEYAASEPLVHWLLEHANAAEADVGVEDAVFDAHAADLVAFARAQGLRVDDYPRFLARFAVAALRAAEVNARACHRAEVCADDAQEWPSVGWETAGEDWTPERLQPFVGTDVRARTFAFRVPAILDGALPTPDTEVGAWWAYMRRLRGAIGRFFRGSRSSHGFDGVPGRNGQYKLFDTNFGRSGDVTRGPRKP